MITVFKTEYELPYARAFVKGEYSDLYVGDEVVVETPDYVLWNAVVETRAIGGAVVRITDVFE